MELPYLPYFNPDPEYSISGSGDSAFKKEINHLKKAANKIRRKTDTWVVTDPNFIDDLNHKLLDLRDLETSNVNFSRQVEEIALVVSSIHQWSLFGDTDYRKVNVYVSELRKLLKIFDSQYS